MQSKDNVSAIKSRLNIVDIVRRYVRLERKGARWTAPCPFHQETKPSFTVDEAQGLFYCFGCQASGDIFEFYGRVNGLTFKESLEQLAIEAGINLERKNLLSDAREQKKRSGKQQMLRMNRFAAEYFSSALHTPEGEECRAYIATRGITEEMSQAFKLGWAGRAWDSLAKALHKAGFNAGIAVEAGLLGQSDKGRLYDRFRGRLIFPISSLSNQIVAFGGRSIAGEDTEEAKYINTQETPLYTKGEHLFGLAQARRGITTKDRALLTEGYMDVLTLHQFGYDNAVGVLGTALTQTQVKRLSGFTSHVTLLFDGDRAGRKAAFRTCEMLLTRGLSCRVALLPDGRDIDDFLRNEGVGAFENLKAAAPDGLRYCLDVLRALAPRETVEWTRGFLRRVELPELLSPYITQLAAHLQLSETVLREGAVAWRRAQKTAGKKQKTEPAQTRQNMRDRQIMMYAIRYPGRLTDLRRLGADMALQSPIAKHLWDKIEEHGEEAVRYFDERETNFWFHCRGAEAPPRDNGDNELNSLCNALDNYYIFTQKSSVSAALRENTTTGDFKSDLDYLRALQETLGKIDEQYQRDSADTNAY
ncbi:MAG: DNA primase [Desulfovibrio sp.]|jgi:DNA primase|nr:DNA primase [Desulfovibrio sp.]